MLGYDISYLVASVRKDIFLQALDRFFKVSERHSSFGTEFLGGLTTFLTMAYIVIVNPGMLQQAGIPFNAALTATCLGAAIMTALMGIISNRPLAMASGMGLDTIVTFGLVLGAGVDWRVGMACVLLEGLITLVLVLCGLREAIMNAIPAGIQHAIGIGIGIFVAFIGLKSGGIIVAANNSSLIKMGSVTSPAALVAFSSIVAAVIFQALHVRGGLLWSILIASVIGVPLGVTQAPSSWNFSLDFSAFAAPLQTTPDGTIALLQVFVQPVLLMWVFSMLMSDFFDTMGTVFAVGQKAGFAKDDGSVEDVRKILSVDAASAAFGGFAGASSITTFAESVSGAAVGARTGLSNLVVAALFLLCAFMAPLVNMISSSATTGALVVVGYLMMCDIGKIEWNDITIAFPAFLTIVGIPLTGSITDGIGLGFISYCLVMVVVGHAREIHPLMWGSAIAFLIAFIVMA